jgi:hypothetical protein
MSWKIIQNNPDKPLDWEHISCNKNITWEIIRDNPDKPWSWYGISCNPNVSWEIIRDNPDKPWNWSGISHNPNMSWEIIRDNPDKPWNWKSISQNSFNYTNKKKEYSARLIQHQVKHWLYSAPNGPMYKKMVRDLQEDGFLLS